MNDAPKEEETGPAVDDDDDDNEKNKSDEEDGGNGDSDDEEVNEAAKQQAKKDSKTVRAMRKHNLGRTHTDYYCMHACIHNDHSLTSTLIIRNGQFRGIAVKGDHKGEARVAQVVGVRL